jgi:hypothetical protein
MDLYQVNILLATLESMNKNLEELTEAIYHLSGVQESLLGEIKDEIGYTKGGNVSDE